ncbi:MAG: gluconate 2-dehydrogenase subunit 3 family protein [Planctomycetota bacterium]|jgi:gluconate 2-dehydrogenase gamma chain|nr:gluconate 2-dehydrogenase subunit 3 family protein [Planctomycetota bacterium]
MSEISSSRRQFLAGAALTLSSLVVTAGLPRLAFAGEPGTRKELLDEYSPVFFSEQEWQCLVAACDRLIPEDDAGPGAIATRVPVFIDRQMQTEYGNGGLWYMHGPFYTDSAPQFGYQYKFTPRDIYRIGLRELDAYCRSARRDAFANLDAAAQDDILHGLESNAIALSSMPGSVFFGQLLANTKEGFFSDPRYGGNKGMSGWKMLGFPGAQGDYREAITRHNEKLNISPVSISRKES